MIYTPKGFVHCVWGVTILFSMNSEERKKIEQEREFQDISSYMSFFCPQNALFESITAKELLTFEKHLADGTRLLAAPYSPRDKLLLELYQYFDTKNGFGPVGIPLQSSNIPVRWLIFMVWLKRMGVPCVIQSLFTKTAHDTPRIFVASIKTEPKSQFSDGLFFDSGHVGSGFSENAEIAASKAFGELLERYFFTVYRRKDLMYTTAENLHKKNIYHVSPKSCQHFSTEQKKEFPQKCAPVEDEVFGWVRGKSLTKGRDAYIPAQLVYWNYNRTNNNHEEPMLFEQNTSGCALHFSKEDAILSGLREVIERDAFLIHWLKKIPPKRISHTSIHNEAIQKSLNELKRYKFRVELCDLTIDTHQRVVVAVAIDMSRAGAAFLVGASCGDDMYKTIQSALSELKASLTTKTYWSKKPWEIPEKYRPFLDMDILRDARMGLATHSKNIVAYEWFVGGEVCDLDTRSVYTAPSLSSPKKLEEINVFFQKQGREIFYFEIKNQALEQLACHAVRVIVPSLIPLYLNETNAGASHPRLGEDVPLQYVSYKEVPIYTYPHPFP